MRFKSIAVLAGMALLSAVAGADTLETPANPSGSAGPQRGMTMAKVEASFGNPARRVEAVGHPPIARWEYPGFVVYFEGDRVIHSVTVKQ